MSLSLLHQGPAALMTKGASMVSPEPVVTPVTRSPSRRTALTIVPNLISAPSPPCCVDQVLVGARRVGITASSS